MGKLHDILGDLKVIKMALTYKPPAADEKISFALMVQNNARTDPDGVALLCGQESISWHDLNARANRVARLLKEGGIVKGDCVSLFMQNRIEFLVNLIGICKLGAIGGLINTNLTRAPLVHCIELITSKKCIFGEELLESLDEVRPELALTDGQDFIFVRDEGDSPPPNWVMEIDSKDQSLDCSNLPETDDITLGDTAFYIFTSGTTGLPKAAVISNKRALPVGMMSADLMLRLNKDDIMYNCLPLYHGTGLLIGFVAVLHAGATMVIRRKLSVSAFWEDIRNYNCTGFIYIGEFIRYLLGKPAQSDDGDNPVQKIVGNGLRPDIWMEFKQRFDINRIGEFYGASEGNGGFANAFNKNCTVGIGIAPATLVQYDVGNDELVRDENGHCIPVDPGETGLLLVEVTEKSEFEGYTSKQASEKKLLRNILVDGDVYFNSGDLMKEVKVGFAYFQKHYQFVDRTGDTFRWKGENVSTNEVGEIINDFGAIQLSNVYGVQIPGTDERAGMAALLLNGESGQTLDIAKLSAHISGNLPSYARPIFLRVLQEIATTSTFKLQKNDLREEAYHLDKVTEDVFVMKPGESIYTKLDRDFYDQIISQTAAF